jgi:endodeoxyribonuclease RusA
VPGFEFVVSRRAVSAQTGKRVNYQVWKKLVRVEAERRWAGEVFPPTAGLRLTVVALCYTDTVDVDNLIKPIQDALVGLVYATDKRVTDVDSHRRFFTDPMDVRLVPPLLRDAWLQFGEFVYIRVEEALPLEVYL